MDQPRVSISRRSFLRSSAVSTVGLAWLPIGVRTSFDLVIKNALIFDGTGSPPYRADVGVSGDRITQVGSIGADQGRRLVEANGACLSPGFIDMHSHSDGSFERSRGAPSRILQGITTEVTGNCGSSAAPKSSCANADDYLARIDSCGLAVNHALLIGHGTLRTAVMGREQRAPTPKELADMCSLLALNLEQGALGLSSGLEYTPGSFAQTSELVALCHVVARYGGLYATHLRDEETYLLDAIEEALDIGRLAGVRVQISHLKASGQSNWSNQGEALAKIENARAQGLDVMADAYPYTAYSTGLSILVDESTREGGTDAMMNRLRESSRQDALRGQVQRRVEESPGAYELIVVASTSLAEDDAIGLNIEEIAQKRSLSPADCVLDLLRQHRGAVSFIGHGMNPQNVERVLAHPLVMIGSDGWIQPPVGESSSKPHPRSYGTCARVLGHYCRERGIFDLATAVRKMTGLPAEQAGLGDRGRITTGRIADMVLFDQATVNDQATFEQPRRYPVGIHRVWVGGVEVARKGRPTFATPGRGLRRS